ncbi:helix-turn-helix transcriptional regulator [Propionibacteriaceae bacterium Y1923]|uniref:helix-turn-helix transcriptional regulator n=1 Tax=Aestuariimicrobium sp. Y1814 TaxID=3418742 RepID=UPI003C210AC3
MNPDQPTDILTTDQVSTMTNIPPATLRYWRHIGEGPKSFKLGRRKVMYRRVDVLAWLEQQYANAS